MEMTDDEINFYSVENFLCPWCIYNKENCDGKEEFCKKLYQLIAEGPPWEKEEIN